MDPQLQKAVTERIQSGLSQADIVAELKLAGYESAESKKIYQTVYASLNSQAQPAPATGSRTPASASDTSAPTSTPAAPSTPPAAGPINTPGATPAPDKVAIKTSRHTGLWIAGAIAVVVLAAGAIAAYTMDMRSILSSLPFISVAPYDEVTLLPGIVANNPDTMTVTTDSGLFLEERDPNVEGYQEIDDLFMFLGMAAAFTGSSLPETASVTATSQLDFDFRHTPPHVSGGGELQLNFDIFNVAMAGSIRTVDSVVYGRIDTFPALMQQLLGNIPPNEWIVLTEGDLSASEVIGATQNAIWRTVADGFVGSTLALFNEDIRSNWDNLPRSIDDSHRLAASDSMTANVFESIDWLPDSMRPYVEDEAAVRERLEHTTHAAEQAWQAYPLIAFRTDPYRERVADETVYVYEVKLAVENVEPFLKEFIAALPDEYAYEAEQDIDILLDDIPTKEEMELINKLFNARLDVRPDGTLYRTLVTGTFTGQSDEITQQLSLNFALTYTNENEDFSIAAPANVYKKTLEELIMEQIMFESMAEPANDDSEEPMISDSEEPMISDRAEPVICDTATITDADGNTYDTVTVGDQCWTKQSLRVGTRINGTLDATDNGTIEKYCYNDDPNNCTSNNPNEPDGALYSWNEAMQYSTTEGAQGICPDGWHIPTYAEMFTMIDYLDSTVRDQNAVVQGNVTVYPENDTMVQLIPGGSSSLEWNFAGGKGDSFFHRGSIGYFWTSSESSDDDTQAQYWRSDSTDGRPWSSHMAESAGFSVRCVKD